MTDELWMQRALALAARGRGRTAPNPTVGCVLVRDGQLVGEGWHTGCGKPHAEVEALRAAGEAARGATLYVTLEPCCHHGRTPPCTDAILSAGVIRAVAGILDADPRVSGRGAARLREAGVDVTVGVLEHDCHRINLPYFVRVRTGLPLVTLKTATSLDGRIATRAGHARWITGEASRARVHALRAEVDAVLVGSGTALADDPQLTCRIGGEEVAQPMRVVLDARGRLSPTAALVTTAREVRTVVMTGLDSPPDWREALARAGVEVETIPLSREGLALRPVLERLAALGANEVLVEGGRRVFSSFLASGLSHRLLAFIAPVLIGGDDAPMAFDAPAAETLAQALRLVSVHVERVGDDALIEGWFSEPGTLGR